MSIRLMFWLKFFPPPVPAPWQSKVWSLDTLRPGTDIDKRPGRCRKTFNLVLYAPIQPLRKMVLQTLIDYPHMKWRRKTYRTPGSILCKEYLINIFLRTFHSIKIYKMLTKEMDLSQIGNFSWTKEAAIRRFNTTGTNKRKWHDYYTRNGFYIKRAIKFPWSVTRVAPRWQTQTATSFGNKKIAAVS